MYSKVQTRQFVSECEVEEFGEERQSMLGRSVMERVAV